MGFVAGSRHGAFGHLDYIGESYFLESAIYLSDGSLELSENGRSDDGNHLFSFPNPLQHIESL